MDNKKEYLYVFTEWCTNLLDLKNDKIYAIDPIRPHRLAHESEYKGLMVGTDTIIGFENKTLGKEFVNNIKLLPPFVYNDMSRVKNSGIVHYKDDLYYLFGGYVAPEYFRVTNTILLYNTRTKEEKEIDAEMSSYMKHPNCLKLKNNKVLIWGKDVNTNKTTYDIFDMETQKIKLINFNVKGLSHPVLLDDGSIFWLGARSKAGKAYILKFKEGVL